MPPRLPRHLKLPTRPGEYFAHAIYNTVGDFLDLTWVRLRLNCYSLGQMGFHSLFLRKQIPSNSGNAPFSVYLETYIVLAEMIAPIITRR